MRFPIPVDQRIDGAAAVGAHKTSMLQDLERGRPMEIDALVTAVARTWAGWSRCRRRRSTRSWRWCACGPGWRAATAEAASTVAPYHAGKRPASHASPSLHACASSLLPSQCRVGVSMIAPASARRSRNGSTGPR